MRSGLLVVPVRVEDKDRLQILVPVLRDHLPAMKPESSLLQNAETIQSKTGSCMAIPDFNPAYSQVAQ